MTAFLLGAKDGDFDDLVSGGDGRSPFRQVPDERWSETA
jgi:hypothetical protein